MRGVTNREVRRYYSIQRDQREAMMSEKERLDVIVRLRFYSTAEGGRKGPTPERIFKCIFVFRSENFDCALMLEGIGLSIRGKPLQFQLYFFAQICLKDAYIPEIQFTCVRLESSR